MITEYSICKTFADLLDNDKKFYKDFQLAMSAYFFNEVLFRDTNEYNNISTDASDKFLKNFINIYKNIDESTVL